MAYDRPYTLDDVARIVEASEHHGGHSISTHTNERPDLFSRPEKPAKKGKRPRKHVPRKDSVFLISRNSLVAIVHEVLNSPSGQTGLRELNDRNVKKAKIKSVLLRQGDGFDIFTVYRPPAPKKDEAPVQTYFDWLATTEGDGFIVQVVIWVSRVAGASNEDIHIHTTFPDDYARTRGDAIVGRRP